MNPLGSAAPEFDWDDANLDPGNLQTACASCNWGKGRMALKFVTDGRISFTLEREEAKGTP
jgi:hypothetical protein